MTLFHSRGGAPGPHDLDAQVVEFVAASMDHVTVEPHQPANLVGGPLPVLGGERVGGQVPHPRLHGTVDGVQQGGLTAGVAVGAGEIAFLGPATVAIHHDRDVAGQELGRDPRRDGAAGMGPGRLGTHG